MMEILGISSAGDYCISLTEGLGIAGGSLMALDVALRLWAAQGTRSASGATGEDGRSPGHPPDHATNSPMD
jgi:hypothetical protein